MAPISGCKVKPAKSTIQQGWVNAKIQNCQEITEVICRDMTGSSAKQNSFVSSTVLWVLSLGSHGNLELTLLGSYVLVAIFKNDHQPQTFPFHKQY